MLINLTATKVSITTAGIAGKVLAFSPDGNTVIVAAPAGNAVYFFNIPNKTVSTYGFPAKATEAAFSPDGYRAYVVAGAAGTPGPVGIWTTGGTLQKSQT